MASPAISCATGRSSKERAENGDSSSSSTTRRGLPVGFQVGGLLKPGILQVRNSHRRIGIGTQLVERCVSIALKRNEPLLLIECTPCSSIPFWERMGFRLFGTKNHAYRILHKHNTAPKRGNAMAVTLRFYPEERKWLSSAKPYLDVSPAAWHSPNGLVHLRERVSFHEAIHSARDTVVEIIMGGDTLYCDKAKYDEARHIGIRRCLNGYFVDRIEPRRTAAAR